jgi:glycosyltransferase involved in cell wall biosynthesis
MSSSLRIIVSGLAGLQPVGGMAWHYLQYVAGLARLGHDVYYHEDTWTWPYDPVKNRNSDSGDYSAGFLADYFEKFAPELRDHWHYLHLHEKSYGMSGRAFTEVAASADLFLNISGANFIPDALNGRCTKVFVDTDPGYNQILLSEKFAWSEFVDRWCRMVAEHDVFFTFAENMDGPDCLVPGLGWEWKTTRMPIVLDLWQPVQEVKTPVTAPWTTIMSWNVFKGPVVYEGVEYGDKSTEFEKILALPGAAGVPVKLALGGGNSPVSSLKDHNWKIIDAPAVTRTASDYQGFISGSRGEISIAKNVYVAMKTGWFSDRSACYLASGRPVVLQDTGFSKFLATGEGLFAFNTQEQATGAIQMVEQDYEKHSKAALEIAHEYFDSDRILGKMIHEIQK